MIGVADRSLSADLFGSVAVFAFLLVDRVGELVEVYVECAQEALDGEPLHATSAALDPRDVGWVHLDPLGKLLLGDPACVAQAPKGAAENAQLGFAGWLAHGRLGIPGQVVVGSAGQKIVGARTGRTAGRRGTESGNSRHASQATSQAARLTCLSSPSGASDQTGGTMNNVTARSVLRSLTTEDRPWTVEELVREQGDRIAVVDAIAELDALGLVNRINRRVVCASRAAIHAEELSI
jgi:hypothetical protein